MVDQNQASEHDDLRRISPSRPQEMISRIALLLCLTSGSAFGQFDVVINSPPDPLPHSIGPRTQLNLLEGGVLSSIRVGGEQSELNLVGGRIGSIRAANEATVNIDSGLALELLTSEPGIAVNVSGGVLGRADVLFDSSITMTGGRVEFLELFRSTARFEGGIVPHLEMDAESQLSLLGGEFRVNGESVADGDVTLRVGDTLTGTLTDGTPFAYFNDSSGADSVPLVPLAGLQSTSLPPAGENVLIDGLSALPGVREDQSLTIVDGADVRTIGIVANNTTVDISGGVVRTSPRTPGSEVRITGGEFLQGFDAWPGARVEIQGGEFEEQSRFVTDTDTSISGGRFHSLRAEFGSSLEISGGEFNSSAALEGAEVVVWGGKFWTLNALQGSDVAIFGGSFPNGLTARPENGFELFGYGFEIDGNPISDLSEIGDSTVVAAQPGTDVTVDGFLASGEPITIQLRSVTLPRPAETSVRFTVMPEPGDFNADGLVDSADHEVWRSRFGLVGDRFRDGDGNGDGMVDAADYTVWRDAMAANANVVPEPTAATLAALATLWGAVRRRRVGRSRVRPA